MGCKKIFQIASLVFTLIIVFAIYVAIFKPDFVLNPAKNFLNSPYANELEVHGESRLNTEDLVVSNSGSIILNEDQVYNLINDKLPQIKISRIELEENKIILFRNIAQKGNPLWLTADIELKEESYKLGRIGFGRVAIPEAFKDQTINWAIEKLGSIGKDENANLDFTKFVGKDTALLLDPKYVTVHKDEMEIKLVDIEPDKFQNILDNIDPKKYTQDVDKTVDEVLKVLNSSN